MSTRTAVNLLLLMLPRRWAYLLYSGKRALRRELRRNGMIYRLRAWRRATLTRSNENAVSS